MDKIFINSFSITCFKIVFLMLVNYFSLLKQSLVLICYTRTYGDLFLIVINCKLFIFHSILTKTYNLLIEIIILVYNLMSPTYIRPHHMSLDLINFFT